MAAKLSERAVLVNSSQRATLYHLRPNCPRRARGLSAYVPEWAASAFMGLELCELCWRAEDGE